MKKSEYAKAGVDIDLGNRVKKTLPELLAATHRPEVLGKVGGFGGLFLLNTKKYQKPVLAASTDGVGTKLKIAFALGRHDTVGQDLVNHCVNDIAVLGAEPIFFLDYIAMGKLEPHVFGEIMIGFSKACAENHCALIGGETAQMPGFYQPGEYDMNGTIVGVVEKSQILNGQKSVKHGDAIIGIASNGLHTNGYSLARKIFFEQMMMSPRESMSGLDGSIGDELMKIHVNYGPLIRKLLKRFNRETPKPIKAFAHITGGGFMDNIPRILPPLRCAVIYKSRWKVPPIFQIIREMGKIKEAELFKVFNMGIGMVAIVQASEVRSILQFIARQGHVAWEIGDIMSNQDANEVQVQIFD